MVLEQLLDTGTSLGCPALASWPPLVAKAEVRGSQGGVVMLSAQCQRAECALTVLRPWHSTGKVGMGDAQDAALVLEP